MVLNTKSFREMVYLRSQILIYKFGDFELQVLKRSESGIILTLEYSVIIGSLLTFRFFSVGASEYLLGCIGLYAVGHGMLILEMEMENSPVITSKDQTEAVFSWYKYT